MTAIEVCVLVILSGLVGYMLGVVKGETNRAASYVESGPEAPTVAHLTPLPRVKR